MAHNLGESSVITPAGNNVLREILRHRGPAKPHVLTMRNRGPANALVGFTRYRDGVASDLVADEQSQVAADNAAGYTGSPPQVVFTGGSLAADAIVPGSLTVNSTSASPEMKDVDGDGILWQQDGARKLGASGVFAAMSNESFVVKIDGGAEQTITLGTEATIAAAAAAIDAQLVGADALEQGAQNVDITSQLLGKGSSVEVVSADAGITTKLGISVGISTNEGGTIDYFSAALELSYQGYIPAAEDITSDYIDTPEIEGGSDIIMRLATIADDDEIVMSAYAANASPILEADLRPMVRHTK